MTIAAHLNRPIHHSSAHLANLNRGELAERTVGHELLNRRLVAPRQLARADVHQRRQDPVRVVVNHDAAVRAAVVVLTACGGAADGGGGRRSGNGGRGACRAEAVRCCHPCMRNLDVLQLDEKRSAHALHVLVDTAELSDITS